MRLPAAAMLAAVAVLACACGGTMSSGELKRELDQIASQAADGELLARDVSANREWRNYVRAHARELADETERGAEKLADGEADGRLAAIKEQGVALALRISQALGQLQVMPDNEAVGRATAARLAENAAATRDLTAGL